MNQMKILIASCMLLMSCKPIFEQRLKTAAATYCAKLELCTKSHYDSCFKGIVAAGTSEGDLEEELQALINYTESATCTDLMKLLDELR